MRAVRASIRGGMSSLSYQVDFHNANFLSVYFTFEWGGGAYPNTIDSSTSRK